MSLNFSVTNTGDFEKPKEVMFNGSMYSNLFRVLISFDEAYH